jgi:hypothetical protein
MTTPHVREADWTDEGGRGLWIVDMSSVSWGVTRDESGQLSVWFELAEDRQSAGQPGGLTADAPGGTAEPAEAGG